MPPSNARQCQRHVRLGHATLNRGSDAGSLQVAHVFAQAGQDDDQALRRLRAG